jgi:hypothetical protein
MALKGGARFRVEHAEVFPAGCLLVPGSIGPVENYDEASRLRTPAFDKVTGLRLYQARVIDRDPGLGTRSRETVVKITAQHQPVPPSGEVICEVEFEGLTVTPYVNDRGRMAYSLRATGFQAPTAGKPNGQAHSQAQHAVPKGAS